MTIVDLTCAFAVLAVLSLSLGSVGVGHGHSIRRAWHESVALRWAQGRLELERALAAAQRLPTAGREAVEVDDELRAALPGAKAVRIVTAVAPGLHEIEVEVQWTSGENAARVRLVTLLAEGGVR